MIRIGDSAEALLTVRWEDTAEAVSLSPEEQAELMYEHPTVFTPAAGAWGRQGWTKVHLSEASARIVTPALLLAWQRVMAKPPARTRKAASRPPARKPARRR